MQLLVSLSVVVALFYSNAASVIPDVKHVDLDSSTSIKGYPLHSAKHVNGYNVESPSGYQNDSSRIIGGHTEIESKWTPWIAAVYRKKRFNIVNWDIDINKIFRFICTGVLIHEYWVLTAAQCVTDVSKDENCDKKYKKIPDEDLKVVIGDLDLRMKTFIGVRGVEYHTKYDRGCKSYFKYDFGLLKLEKEQNAKRIICISTSRGPDGILFGFGRSSPKAPRSSVLKYYRVKMISDDDCRVDWNLDYISKSKICYEGRKQGERSCRGDSGGPLVVGHPYEFKLIAIASYFAKGCMEGYQVAARIYYVRDWITDVVGSYTKC